jgi:hypothetical protein
MASDFLAKKGAEGRAVGEMLKFSGLFNEAEAFAVRGAVEDAGIGVTLDDLGTSRRERCGPISRGLECPTDNLSLRKPAPE